MHSVHSLSLRSVYDMHISTYTHVGIQYLYPIDNNLLKRIPSDLFNHHSPFTMHSNLINPIPINLAFGFSVHFYLFQKAKKKKNVPLRIHIVKSHIHIYLLLKHAQFQIHYTSSSSHHQQCAVIV